MPMFSANFWTNPQYQVTVVDPDPDDNDGTGTLIIGLMQKDRRKLRSQGLNELTIGYAVYKVGMQPSV
jgi:calpain